MKMTIIVPTDFSSNAKYAAEYACELAESKDYGIHLLHSYTTSSVLDEGAEEPNDPTLKADESIQELKDELLQQYPGLSITFECSRSLIIDKLTELSSNNEYGMIIMGASGESQHKPIYYGSTTLAVAAKSEIPVLVIPNKPTQLDNTHVALLTNFKPEELDTLKAYMKWIANVDELTLIHVFKDSQKKQNVDDTLNSWAFNIREMVGIGQVNSISEQVHSDDESLDTVPEVVNNLIDQVNPSIILVTPSRKTFFERLFKSSVSKAIALELNKPAFFEKV